MLISRRRETSHGSLPVGIAVGDDAVRIEAHVLEALDYLRPTDRGVALDALFSVFLECAKLGWDGSDAQPITADTFALARDFLYALPTAFPSPEVAPLEDGSISLDWFPSPDSSLSIAVFPDRRLIFASVSTRRRIRGAEVMDDDVPGAIIAELRRLY